MPERSDPRRESARPDHPDPLPEQAAVERAIRAAVERLSPGRAQPEGNKSGQDQCGKGKPGKDRTGEDTAAQPA